MPAFRKARPGRPPNLNEELIKGIVNALRAGAYVETAAAVNGVPKKVFYDWLGKSHPKKNPKTGKINKPKDIYVQLRVAVEKGMEEAVMRDLTNIDKCAMGTPSYLKDVNGKLILDDQGNPKIDGYTLNPDWRASAWRLERRNPKTWGRFDRIEATGKDGESLAPTSIISPAQVIFTLPQKVPVPDDPPEDEG